MFGWQINQGADKEALYISAERLQDHLKRRDLIAAKINGDPKGELNAWRSNFDLDRLLQLERAKRK